MKTGVFASIALAVVAAGSTRAHHNMEVTYDLNQRFTQTGTLTELDWRNPHIDLSVDVTSDQGQVDTWRFEGGSPVHYPDGDVDRIDFENSIGRTVTVNASPARDGSLSGLSRTITLANGKTALMCPSNC